MPQDVANKRSAESSNPATETSVHEPEKMRFETALAERSTSSCNLQSFPISSAVPTCDVMTRSSTAFKPLLAALLVTLMQIAMAVGLLLSDRGLFGVAFSHDAAWFHLLEQRRGSYRESVGDVARYRDVCDADCRNLVCSVSGDTLGVREGMAPLARAAGMVSRPGVGDWLKLCGSVGRDRVFCLLPTVLEPLGHVYGDAVSRVGEQ